GLAGKVDDINRAAVEVARQVAAEGEALVAGNLSLTWAYDPSDAKAVDHVRALFDRQLEGQMDVGIDLVVAATFSYLGEALIAVERSLPTGLPVVVTMSYERDPRSYEGDAPGECARKLADAGAHVVGVNCLRSPEQTLPLMEEMRAAVPGFVACQPVGYRTGPEAPDFTALPEFPFALDPLQLPRPAMAARRVKADDMG